MDSSQLLAF